MTASAVCSPVSLPRRSRMPARPPRGPASMAQSRLTRRARRLPMLAPAFLLAALALPAPAESAAPTCGVPAELVLFNRALPHLAERVAQRCPVTIVAIGSSSTAGVGASSAAATYPGRLEAML